MRLRLLALGCVVFLAGAGFGFYEAHAAGAIKYDAYLFGKDVGKAPDAYLSGYAAGSYDTLSLVAWVANEAPKAFTAETFTNQYLCLQKIPSASETVAFAKDFWRAKPDSAAANQLFIHACEYSTSARSSSMTKAGKPSHSRSASFTLTK